MIFRGISLKFSTTNEVQYDAIGAFYDAMRTCYPEKELRGLGYNWTGDKIEYVIGFSSNECVDIDPIKRVYEGARYKEVLLPDVEMMTYYGRTDALSELYDEIYKDGSLTYEIETFYEDGSCKVEITREDLILHQLTMQDEKSVHALYQSALGSAGCVWDEEYPSMELLTEDIKNGDLYGIKNDDGELVASLARDRDPEVENLTCWNKDFMPSAEIARVVVREDYKNQGLARIMIKQLICALKMRGFKSAHYLVEVNNVRAINSYKTLSFKKVGEADLFTHHYDCYEIEL